MTIKLLRSVAVIAALAVLVSQAMEYEDQVFNSGDDENDTVMGQIFWTAFGMFKVSVTYFAWRGVDVLLSLWTSFSKRVSSESHEETT